MTDPTAEPPFQDRRHHRPGLQLAGDQVDVWLLRYASLDPETCDNCRTLLDRDELARYGRLQSRTAREQLLLGRALIRIALSHYEPVPEASWRLAASEHGRPGIAAPSLASPLHFNLSHTPGVVAVAVARHPEIGIDVEAIDRQIDSPGVAALVFGKAETIALGGGRGELSHEDFCRLWTLKEAYIKARGMGFSLPPRAFELINEDGAFSLSCKPACDANPERWQFLTGDLATGHMLALAVGTRAPLRLRGIACRSLRERLFEVVDDVTGRSAGSALPLAGLLSCPTVAE